MITYQAIEIEEKTKKEAIRILETNPYISKNKLENIIRQYNGHASSGIISRIYNKHRRNIKREKAAADTEHTTARKIANKLNMTEGQRRL